MSCVGYGFVRVVEGLRSGVVEVVRQKGGEESISVAFHQIGAAGMEGCSPALGRAFVELYYSACYLFVPWTAVV